MYQFANKKVNIMSLTWYVYVYRVLRVNLVMWDHPINSPSVRTEKHRRKEEGDQRVSQCLTTQTNVG